MDEFDIEDRKSELERRGLVLSKPKKLTPAPKIPAKNPKKIANRKAAKAKVKAAGPDAADKKKELKKEAEDKHKVMTAAGKAYNNTHGLPNRTDKYKVPAGGGESHSCLSSSCSSLLRLIGRADVNFTGKDLRKSLFAAHVNNQQKQADNGGRVCCVPDHPKDSY
jgi:hypothetical protein